MVEYEEVRRKNGASSKYSKRTPMAEGWYWLNIDGVERVVEVFIRPGHSYLCIQEETEYPQKRNFMAVYNLPYLWAGPIPRPTE